MRLRYTADLIAREALKPGTRLRGPCQLFATDRLCGKRCGSDECQHCGWYDIERERRRSLTLVSGPGGLRRMLVAMPATPVSESDTEVSS